jgi:hypothetical protein
MPFQAWWVDSLQQVLVEDTAAQLPLPGELHAARGEFEAVLSSENMKRLRAWGL